jgi:hypothetical protein
MATLEIRWRWKDNIKMEFREIDFDGRMAQDLVQRQALVLAVLNLQVLLPGNSLSSKMDLREAGYEDGRWMELAQDRVQWQALMLVVLHLQILLPESVNQ